MIYVVDYGSGNTFSVYNSLSYLGYDAKVTSNPADLKHAERIILPGVGAFGECMAYLRETGLKDALDEEVLVKKKPFLGICLGMQMLATTGYEKGCFEGFNWIPGEVVLFDLPDKSLKVPHVGWNDITICVEHPVLRLDGKDSAFYFVHSYHFVTKHEENKAITCNYGIDFVCGVAKDNIIGTQFHPEKSQKKRSCPS